jgi:hypothetical protein
MALIISPSALTMSTTLAPHACARSRCELKFAGTGKLNRSLKAAGPSDLSIEQLKQFVINLQTATTLDLTIPPSMLLCADEVIE